MFAIMIIFFWFLLAYAVEYWRVWSESVWLMSSLASLPCTGHNRTALNLNYA